MFQTAFLQKLSIISKPYDRFFSNFSKLASEHSSFMSESLKSIVTVELASKNTAGQILP